MPLFEQAAAAMSSMCDYAISVVYTPVAATQQLASIFKQSRAKTRSFDASIQEVASVAQLAFECSQLTPREMKEYADSDHFSALLNDTISHEGANDGAVLLQDANAVLCDVTQAVDEYLATAQLLHPQHEHSLLSYRLRNTISTIIDNMHISDSASSHISTGIVRACALIENITFNRCQPTKRLVDHRLRQYVDINEMLQLLHVLQEKINSIPSDDIHEYMHRVCMTRAAQEISDDASVTLQEQTEDMYSDDEDAQTERPTVSILRNPRRRMIADSIAEAAEVIQVFRSRSGLVNISSIIQAYLSNAQLLVKSVHVFMYPREPYDDIVHMGDMASTDATMHYDTLIATQVFAALAIRRELYYEMQRNFNDTREAQVNTVIQACHTLEAGRQSSLANNIVQLRIAHAVRTYCMYNILEALACGLLATNITQLSYETHIDLLLSARVAELIINPVILDGITQDMAVELTEYIYAAALTYAINKHYDNDAYQLQQCFQTMCGQHKEDIAYHAIAHVFGNMHRIVVSKLKIVDKVFNTSRRRYIT